MSLNWNWNECIGYRTVRDERNNTEWYEKIYHGNALAIFINEYDENGKEMYQLMDFWADETHMKRMLGYPIKGETKQECSYTKPYYKVVEYKFFADKVIWSKFWKILKGILGNYTEEEYPQIFITVEPYFEEV